MSLLKEQLEKKWSPIINYKGVDEIKDNYKKAVTVALLENEELYLKENSKVLAEANFNPSYTPSNTTAQIDRYDPILIGMVRRAIPNLIAFDICGVQPMTAPTGLIFALRSLYVDNGQEAFYNEPRSGYSGDKKENEGEPINFGEGEDVEIPPSAGSPLDTLTGEQLTGSDINEMSFTIDKTSIEAKSRMLKAEYSLELTQDLKAVHNLDAETELSNILSTEILADINREVTRTVYKIAKLGCQDTVTPGVWDVNNDADGRWSAEKFRGLFYQIEKEANKIAYETRRDRGNFIICSPNVVSALSTASLLINPTVDSNKSLSPDFTNNTYAGVLNNRYSVYVDPFAQVDFVVVGYKGSSPYDAGMFYCPYVPLQPLRAISESSFQPKIAFKTRYGMIANPFAEGLTKTKGELNARKNVYYRIFQVTGL